MTKGKALEAKFKKAWFGVCVHGPPTCHQLGLILLCLSPLQYATGAPRRTSTSFSSCHDLPWLLSWGAGSCSVPNSSASDSGDYGNGSCVSAKRPRFRRAVQRASCLLLSDAQSIKRIWGRLESWSPPKPRMCWCTMLLFWVLETSFVLRSDADSHPWFLKTVIICHIIIHNRIS